MNLKKTQQLSVNETATIIETLKLRFDQNLARHQGVDWSIVVTILVSKPDKLWSLNEMERTGGEPDIITSSALSTSTKEFIFYDCSYESPKGRRSLCYDRAALDARKEFKPQNSVIDLASEMGVELLNEEQYRYLQQFGNFDSKSQSWIKTPDSIRKLGGALFADYRYGAVFVYHNGVQSYYATRGFRSMLKL